MTKVVCANCSRELDRPAWRIKRAERATGPLAGLFFCDRGCQKRRFRVEHRCCWPGCAASVFITGQRQRLKHHGGYFCADHMALMRKQLGVGAPATLSRRAFLAGQPMGHRRATGKFVRFVVFEMSKGACQGCGAGLDRAAFFVDHRHPVFEGGETSISNLQALCRACHLEKTAREQKRANGARWSKAHLAANARNMTHVEKDALIQRLMAEIAALKAKLGERLDEHAP